MTEQNAESALGARIADAARRSGRSVGAAESVSGGHISSALAAAEGAVDWFSGAVTAYSEKVKFSVLGVQPGPVITAECARQMAAGGAALLQADYVVSTTGAGGPASEEGQPAGTVFIAVSSPTGCMVSQHHFDGDPPTVVHAATEQALRELADVVEDGLRQ